MDIKTYIGFITRRIQIVAVILIALILVHCGDGEEPQTCGPTPDTYFDVDGNELTSCGEINFCNNPPSVFDSTGSPFECDE